MAKKKALHPNRKKHIAIASASAVAIVAVLVAAVMIYNAGLSYILVHDDVKYSTAEYELYLMDQKYTVENYLGSDIWAEPEVDGVDYVAQAQDNAIRTLVSTLAVKDKAAEWGVALGDGDEEAIETSISNIESYYGETIISYAGLSAKELRDMGERYVLYDKVYAEATKDYEIDEDTFQESYAESLVTNEQSLTTVNVNYVKTEDENEAHVVRKLLEDGANILELIPEYSIDYVEGEESEDGEDYVSVTASGLSQEIIDAAYEMGDSEFSSVFLDDDGNYVIFQVAGIIEPDYVELEASYRESYISSEQSTFFNELLEGWMTDVEYTLNQRAYNKIDITKL